MMYGNAPRGLHQEFINKNYLYGTVEVSTVEVGEGTTGTYYIVVKVTAVNDSMSVGLRKTLFISSNNSLWID